MGSWRRDETDAGTCNLIGNAQKFTERGGTVAIRLAVQTVNRAIISVRDTGVGIDAALLPKVFEAYTQADQSVSRSRGGLGLGLALVKGVVELHGGSVLAASDGPATGATFTLELPLCETAEAKPANHPVDGPSPVKSRSVLIIEDNSDSAQSLKVYLELHGHTIATAKSGPDGLKAAAISNRRSSSATSDCLEWMDTRLQLNSVNPFLRRC